MQGGSIFRAIKRYQWPNEGAAVVVSIVHIAKGKVISPMLNGKHVTRVSAYLVEGALDASPTKLIANSDMSFKGSELIGSGFLFDNELAQAGSAEDLSTMQVLIDANPAIRKRIKPFLAGEDLNRNPLQSTVRFVIDLGGLTEEQAENQYPELMEIVRRRVQPNGWLGQISC
jgi:hypothetical protein